MTDAARRARSPGRVPAARTDRLGASPIAPRSAGYGARHIRCRRAGGATVTARHVRDETFRSTAVTDTQGTYQISPPDSRFLVVEVELVGLPQDETGRSSSKSASARGLDFALTVGGRRAERHGLKASCAVGQYSRRRPARHQPDGSQKESAALACELGRSARARPAACRAIRYTEQAGSTAAGRTGGVTVHGVARCRPNFLPRRPGQQLHLRERGRS